jgi:hypothetical protein
MIPANTNAVKSFEYIESFAANRNDSDSLKKEWKKVFGGKGITTEQADAYLKYINAEVHNRDLVGFELLIDFKQPINLVEGGLDAVTLGYNTIPLFGKTISDLLKKRVIENDTPEIRVILDDDALKESIQISEMFTKMGRKVKLVKLDGKDPNKLGRYRTQEIISNTKILSFSDIIKYKIK